MPVASPYTKTVSNGHRYVHSNYAFSYDVYNGDVEYIYRNAGGTKRLNWKRLPYPQRSEPLGYGLVLDSYRNVQYNTTHTEQGPDGLGGIQFNYNYQQGWSTGDPWANRDQSVVSDSDYLAKARFYSKMKGEGANIANMLGERKQAVKSIENLLNIIVYTVRDLRRGNITSAIRRMGGDPLTARKLRKKDIADQWLSLQYGWLPMLSDVYSICNNLHVRHLVAVHTFRSQATAKGLKKSPEIGGGVNGNESRGTIATTAKTTYTIRVKPDNAVASLAALGVTNPLVVAWELTPWSFVVDWFLPVGNFLEQLTADHGFTFYDGCKSQLIKSLEVAEGSWSKSYSAGAWTYFDSRSISGRLSSVHFTRSTLTGFPSVDLPRFKNPLSIGHFKNALALLTQLFSKR